MEGKGAFHCVLFVPFTFQTVQIYYMVFKTVIKLKDIKTFLVEVLLYMVVVVDISLLLKVPPRFVVVI